MNDLWTIRNPDPLLIFAGLPGIIASGPESVTMLWAVPQYETTVAFSVLLPPKSDDQELKIKTFYFTIDREKHEFVFNHSK